MTFDEWFIKQHGPRPSDRDLSDLGLQYASFKVNSDIAQKMYETCKEWENRRTSALWAWQFAQTNTKTGEKDV